jgi:hypothetical protein
MRLICRYCRRETSWTPPERPPHYWGIPADVVLGRRRARVMATCPQCALAHSRANVIRARAALASATTARERDRAELALQREEWAVRTKEEALARRAARA